MVRMAGSGGYTFFTRMVKFQHMEFDSAFQQVAWAILAPKKLYRHHEIQFKTRQRWSRDDPAFLLCICGFMAASAVVYSIILRLGLLGLLLSLLWAVFVDCIGSGLLVASVMWVVSNKLLLRNQVKDGLEWAYCFDIHLNSLVPLALIIFGVHVFVIRVLDHRTYLLTAIADTLWVCGLSGYIYSTFLGYSVTSRLKNTVWMLGSVLLLLVMFSISVPLQWNWTVWLTSYYALRTGN